MKPTTSFEAAAAVPASTSTRGRLPDFVIVGAAKSGTTSLFDHLCQHPGVFGSNPKEPCFLDPQVNLAKGLDWYRGLFAKAEPWQVCGEASTNYSRYPQVEGVPERLAELVPHAKLLYLMRHPVERAYSHYVHAFTKEEYPRTPFDLSFEAFAAGYPRVLDGSDYRLQLERYYAHFPREQVLLLFLEDLERDPRGVCTRVFEFLGVDADYDPFGGEDPGRKNVGAEFREGRVRGHLMQPLKQVPGLRAVGRLVGQRGRDAVYTAVRLSPLGRRVSQAFSPLPLSPRVRQLLLQRYAPTVDYVEQLTGRDLSDWRR